MFKKIAMFLVALAALIFLAARGYAQESKPAPKSTPPAMSELHQAKLQSLVAKRQLVQEKANRLQLEYDKNVKELQEQFAKVSADLEVEVKAAYADAKTTTEAFDINVDDGKFVEKAKINPPAPAPATTSAKEGK